MIQGGLSKSRSEKENEEEKGIPYIIIKQVSMPLCNTDVPYLLFVNI